MLKLFIIHLIFFTNKGQIGCFDIIEHQHIYLVKKYIIIVKYRDVQLQILSDTK
jgi:hypothetical protein